MPQLDRTVNAVPTQTTRKEPSIERITRANGIHDTFHRHRRGVPRASIA